MVCHTAQGGKPYAGGFAFTLPFGTLYSTTSPRTVRPDQRYSDADFLARDAPRRSPDGARLYPAMPYTSYTYVTDADALGDQGAPSWPSAAGA